MMPAASFSQRRSIPGNARILILPGFGNDSSDYFLEQFPQGSLVQSLCNRGWSKEQIRVMPMQRSDWLQVFLKGALDLKFWQAQAPPTRPAFQWYLNRVSEQMQELCADSPDTQVVLLGHSAGGWLARAALGFGTYDADDAPYAIDLDRILGMVTLGAPHLPPPPEIMDMTRGALRITHEQFPGAYHKPDGLFYITVIGNVIRGEKQERKNPFEPTSATGFAYNSYEAVCGEGTAIGDGVVPLDAAHLDDAVQLELDGVFHSINVPERWYGSDSQLDGWHDLMLDEIARRQQNRVMLGGPLKNLFR